MEEMERNSEREEAESPSTKEKRQSGRNTMQSLLRVNGGDKPSRWVGR